MSNLSPFEQPVDVQFRRRNCQLDIQPYAIRVSVEFSMVSVDRDVKNESSPGASGIFACAISALRLQKFCSSRDVLVNVEWAEYGDISGDVTGVDQLFSIDGSEV